jgi:hypothetical protein
MQGDRDPQEEQHIVAALQHHYGLNSALLGQEWQRSRRQSWFCVAWGLGILALALQVEPWGQGILWATLNQGLGVGGWVFLWEGISRLTWGNPDLHERWQVQRRFLHSQVLFA